MGTKPEDLEAAMTREIEKVQNNLIGEQEFQKLKNQTEAEFVTRNASVAGIAESLANYEMYFGDANLINAEIERYNKVTREDIQRVARKYLTKENRLMLYYLPNSAKPAPEVKQPDPQPAQAQTPAPEPPNEEKKGRRKKK